MKIKKEYVILFTLILTLALYLILRDPDRTQYQLPDVPNIGKADISKIEISKPDATIVLDKKDDTWHIAPEGYRADTDRVRNMLEILKGFAVTALVSESRSYSRYDLGDDKKITVRAWTGDTLAREFDLGKAATSYQHTFVKLAGDDRIYHVQGDFRGKFDQTLDNLRDKTVLSFDLGEIQEIHITKGGEVIAFALTQLPVEVTAGEAVEGKRPESQKSKRVWKTSSGAEGDETQLNRLLSTLSSLQCEAYVEGKNKEDFANPICQVQLKGSKEYMLFIFKKTDKDAKTYPAVSSENDYPFLLPEWQANNLMKTPDELLKKPDKP
ncbi:MAG: hypothetical protein AMK69_03495 [Nitrospira bacterium SG8_3]|nr:MAG: hypothetical protein AMK69_03495 [Nitrospira bacterium SG8_3]